MRKTCIPSLQSRTEEPPRRMIRTLRERIDNFLPIRIELGDIEIYEVVIPSWAGELTKSVEDDGTTRSRCGGVDIEFEGCWLVSDFERRVDHAYICSERVEDLDGCSC